MANIAAVLTWGALPGTFVREPVRFRRAQAAAADTTSLQLECHCEVVAVLLVGFPPGGEWVKTGKSPPGGMVVNLFCRVAGPEFRPGAHVSISALGAFSNMPFTNGPLPSPPLRVEAPERAQTGEAIRLAACLGAPPVELGLILLAAADVKFGRGRIWHLKAGRLGDDAGPLAGTLTHGRSGRF